MLGTLPSAYLKWLAEAIDVNGSLSYWSELTELVLQDPVYQDRIEWEPALRLFSGTGLKGNFIQGRDSKSFDVMRVYREIGERFGWDMEDKEGWSKVNRDLIGTSFSGRIPRKSKERGAFGVSESVKRGEREDRGGSVVEGKRGERTERMRLKREKVPGRIEEREEVSKLGFSDSGYGVDVGRKVGFLVGKKRGVRIERMRLRRERNLQMAQSDKGEEEEILEEEREEDTTIRTMKERVSTRKEHFGRRNGGFGVGKKDGLIDFAMTEEEGRIGDGEIFNPFPGRDALIHSLTDF